MNVTYWTGFSKRKNSTKRPSSGTTLTGVYLKEDTTVMNPGLELDGVPATANYFYISDFGRYYYVRNVTKAGAARNYFDLECDILATYKSQVGSYSGLIEYAADSTNIHLTDPRNKPQQTFYETKTQLLDLGSNQFSTGGTFIVGITGGPGGVTYYVMDAPKLRDFYNDVFGLDFTTQITAQFYNVRDCIVSCKWAPYTPAIGLAQPVYVGGLMSGVSAPAVAVRIKTIADASYNITFPSDSLIGPGYGTNYLDTAPFSTGTLYLPFVGIVPLDLDVVSQSKQLRIACAVDNYTQDIVYKISNDSGDYVNTYQGNCGTNIPIVSQTMNALGSVASAVGAVGGVVAATAGAAPVAAALGATSVGAANVAASMQIHTQANGSYSSALAAQMGLAAYATVFTRKPTVETLTDFAPTSGMPLFEVDTISNHAGYVQCFGASIDIPGTPDEKDTLNGYVNGGFFYE